MADSGEPNYRTLPPTGVRL